MSTIQIQPGNPNPSSPPPEGDDLYDPRYWETAYREMHNVPALLIQLQDDLARSRRRESLWISVIVHIVVILIIFNSDALMKYLPRPSFTVVSPNDALRDKPATFLELPPDAEKVKKRPNTDKVSDKDRIAMSRHPQLNAKELKKILDASRPGAPGLKGPPLNRPPQPQSPPAQAMAQANPAPQQMQESTPAQPREDTNQVAKLNAPPAAMKPNFSTPATAGAAIQQAARAALANRGGYGGDNGDYGLGQGQSSQALGQLDVLSDTMGVDFAPYLSRVLHDVRQNWYMLIPEVARAPLMKKGKVSIDFVITRDGRVDGMRLTQDGSSGDTALDRAAWGGITASNPFPPLPTEFRGQYLALRLHFLYNPDSNDLR
jgi:TonB family protein